MEIAEEDKNELLLICFDSSDERKVKELIAEYPTLKCKIIKNMDE